MAIHVRSTRRTHRIWRELRVKLARLAVIVAVLIILFSGTSLYLIRIFSPPPPSASFIAWQEPPQEPQQPEPPEKRSAGAVKPVQSVVRPIIISSAETLSLPDALEIEIDDAEDVLADSSVDFGADQGKSIGDGQGDSGGGGRGNGGALGYNDDVQVVLALDASGSMDRLFQAVADSLEELLRTLGECRVNGQPASVNVGIVVYGHSRDDGAPYQLAPFTLDLEQLRRPVKAINCDGVYENCGEAIAFAVKNYPWNKRKRSRLLKVLFIAGNESFDQGSVNYRDALTAAGKQGIIVNTIHCGEPNPEWVAAARSGGGEGLTFAMNAESVSGAAKRAERRELIEALYHIPLLPVGTPAEQAALRAAHAARPPLPDMSDESAVRNWERQYLHSLLRGSRGDAVELCRQLGDVCTVDSLGGRGNLPPELRGLPDAKIMDIVSRQAGRKQEIIHQLRRRNDSSFIGKVLETLIQQAAARGIDITR